mmetsp:Transcript_23449/g.65679  ORF Transcript_23449/g.65679 Transcript_23449/m.65679 type:complete len:241 (-) Transcript_23449:154-876(-)
MGRRLRGRLRPHVCSEGCSELSLAAHQSEGGRRHVWAVQVRGETRALPRAAGAAILTPVPLSGAPTRRRAEAGAAAARPEPQHLRLRRVRCVQQPVVRGGSGRQDLGCRRRSHSCAWGRVQRRPEHADLRRSLEEGRPRRPVQAPRVDCEGRPRHGVLPRPASRAPAGAPGDRERRLPEQLQVRLPRVPRGLLAGRAGGVRGGLQSWNEERALHPGAGHQQVGRSHVHGPVPDEALGGGA